MRFQYVVSRISPDRPRDEASPLPWYMFSEIGGMFDGKPLQLSEFERVEAAYYTSIRRFIDACRASRFRIVGREVAPDFASRYGGLAQRETVSVDEAMALVRASLRQEGFWAILVSEDLVIRPGSGIHVYIGTNINCASVVEQINGELFAYEDYSFAFEIPETTPWVAPS